MPDKKEEETPEAGVRKIDLRVLERGVRKALAIEPKDHSRQEKQERGSPKNPARKNKKD